MADSPKNLAAYRSAATPNPAPWSVHQYIEFAESLGVRGRLTEENIADTLRQVRMALLEADVALPVVKAFDFACPYCQQVSATMEELVKKDGVMARMLLSAGRRS